MRGKKCNVNSNHFSVPFWSGFDDFLECLRLGVIFEFIFIIVSIISFQKVMETEPETPLQDLEKAKTFERFVQDLQESSKGLEKSVAFFPKSSEKSLKNGFLKVSRMSSKAFHRPHEYPLKAFQYIRGANGHWAMLDCSCMRDLCGIYAGSMRKMQASACSLKFSGSIIYSWRVPYPGYLNIKPYS